MSTTSSTAPLRVAIACSGLGHVARGIEAWAMELGLALKARGDVSAELFSGAPIAGAEAVGCFRRSGGAARGLSSVFSRLGGWRFGMGSAYEAEQLSFAANLWRRIGRDFDLLHVQDPLIAAFFERARRLGVSRPRVILANGTGERPETLRRFSHVQHLTPDAAAAWEPQRPPGQASFTIPNFINTASFTPAGRAAARARLDIPADRIVVFCCAAIRAFHKRIDVLLREFALARSQPGGERLFLLLAGGREADTPALQAMASSLLGDDAVRIEVGVPREKIVDRYNAADIFILPSLHELFGMVFLEALACGVPVISHDAASFRYVCGPAALYADLGAEGGIAQAVAALMEDAPRAELARLARPHVEQNFSAQAVIPQVIGMYRKVAEREHRI